MFFMLHARADVNNFKPSNAKCHRYYTDCWMLASNHRIINVDEVRHVRLRAARNAPDSASVARPERGRRVVGVAIRGCIRRRLWAGTGRALLRDDQRWRSLHRQPKTAQGRSLPPVALEPKRKHQHKTTTNDIQGVHPSTKKVWSNMKKKLKVLFTNFFQVSML